MTTPSRENPPQFNNMPVILVHFTVQPSDGAGPDMYWCAPYVVTEDIESDYPNIPRVPCPGCSLALRIARDNSK